MRYAERPLQFAYNQDNLGTPATAYGTVANLGLNNADHATIVSLMTLTFDCELLEINITDANTGATGVDSSALLDIVIDPAGGTSWNTSQRLIQSLMCGYTSAISGVATHHRTWRFPLWLKEGTAIGAVGRNITAADKTCSVAIRARGGVSDPKQWWCGQRVDALGEDRVNSSGTQVAPNASTNTFGSWTNIGAPTARRYGQIVLSAMPKSASTFSVTNEVQAGVGGVQIGARLDFQSSTLELMSQPGGGFPTIQRVIPEGTQLQARCRANNNGSHTNQVIIHGVS